MIGVAQPKQINKISPEMIELAKKGNASRPTTTNEYK